MLDIGWSEMAVIALLALIVIGPKDLPRVMRSIGQWTRKARSIAREFQSSLDDMMRESELDEAKKTIERSRHFDVGRELEKEVDPTGSVRADADELNREARADVEGASTGATGARHVRHDTPMAPGHSVHAGKSTASGAGETSGDGKARTAVGAAAADDAAADPRDDSGGGKRGGGSSAGASGTDG